MKQLFVNPVLQKEIKLRFRSKKGFIGVAAFLTVLGVLSLGIIGLQLHFYEAGIMRPDESRATYMIISMLQLALVIFITPGLTAGVISGERERQTLPILLTTTLTSSTIVFSKLFSSIAYLLLIIFSTLPIYTILFLYGGISPLSVIASFGLYLFTMLVIGSIAILATTVIRRTVLSMVTTYSIAFFITGGLAILTMMLASFSYSFAQQGASFPVPYFLASINIPIMFASLFEADIFFELQRVSGVALSPWIIFFSFYIPLISLCLFLAIKKLRPKMKTKIS